MQEEHLTRQADLIPSNVLGAKIVIVGAGAIGSFTALTLAKMGFSDITVYDDDDVSVENMNCQFFSMNSIGKPKVDALEQMVYEFTGTEITTFKERVTDDKLLHGDIVIAAVDSMAARTTIVNNCAAKWLIDGRMGAEYIMMYTVLMSDLSELDNYRKSLYTDDEAVQERCTAKATMYTVNLIAGLIGKTVKDIVTDYEMPITGLDWSVAKNSAIWFNRQQKLTL